LHRQRLKILRLLLRMTMQQLACRSHCRVCDTLAYLLDFRIVFSVNCPPVRLQRVTEDGRVGAH
jgi:hypothetical protein